MKGQEDLEKNNEILEESIIEIENEPPKKKIRINENDCFETDNKVLENSSVKIKSILKKTNLPKSILKKSNQPLPKSILKKKSQPKIKDENLETEGDLKMQENNTENSNNQLLSSNCDYTALLARMISTEKKDPQSFEGIESSPKKNIENETETNNERKVHDNNATKNEVEENIELKVS